MIKKNLWIRNILACVQEISSREYQERAWLRNEVYAPCSFEEMMCGLFDDCFIREFINEKADEFGLSFEQKAALSDLVNALDKYGDNPEIYFSSPPLEVDESKILLDPEWLKIRKMAQKVLSAFGKIKYEPEDKEWWLQFILHSISTYSDIEEQRRMWIDKSEIFWSTPLDMYESLFTSLEFDYFMDEYAKKFALTEEQIAVLDRFRFQLKKTPFKTTNPENILDNPEWQKLQLLAREARGALALSVHDN